MVFWVTGTILGIPCLRSFRDKGLGERILRILPKHEDGEHEQDREAHRKTHCHWSDARLVCVLLVVRRFACEVHVERVRQTKAACATFSARAYCGLIKAPLLGGEEVNVPWDELDTILLNKTADHTSND